MWVFRKDTGSPTAISPPTTATVSTMASSSPTCPMVMEMEASMAGASEGTASEEMGAILVAMEADLSSRNKSVSSSEQIDLS